MSLLSEWRSMWCAAELPPEDEKTPQHLQLRSQHSSESGAREGNDLPVDGAGQMMDENLLSCSCRLHLNRVEINLYVVDNYTLLISAT